MNFDQVLVSFVIGSCILVILPFLLGIYLIPDLKSQINMCTYPIIAMVYFGLMNVLALILGELFDLSLFQRLLLITVISVLCVSFWITYRQIYTWTDPQRWLLQYCLIALGHSLAFLGIIYGITLIVSRYAPL